MHVGVVVLFQDTRCCRRREHDVDLVLLDDLPPDARVRAQRRSLVHDGTHATDQRAVNDVRAVSYTHLDVYKRQVEARPHLRAWLPGA